MAGDTEKPFVHKWTPPKPPDPMPTVRGLRDDEFILAMMSECGIDLLELGAEQTTSQWCWTTCPKCLQRKGIGGKVGCDAVGP